jgi:type II secretory ATPase GspE/PulE/Tfp pilus assembly ATPase PilB-like protein
LSYFSIYDKIIYRAIYLNNFRKQLLTYLKSKIMDSKNFINEILTFASENNYSDIHISSNDYPKIRNRSGEIEELRKVFEKELNIIPEEDIAEIIKELI